MFREMRRKRQQLEKEECERILKKGSAGVLALHGEDGYPYAVPISYVYDGERIFFHSAKSGHKIDAIRHCPKASLCVIDQDEVVPEQFTTYFKSVIVFGSMHFLEEEQEKRCAIERLAQKYSPDESKKSMDAEIEKSWKALTMIEMKIEQMTGKQSIELVNN